MAEEIKMKSSEDYISAGKDAGDSYAAELSSIKDNLTSVSSTTSGTSLGQMVESQLQITNAEAGYEVGSGLANKGMKAVKAAASAVKQA